VAIILSSATVKANKRRGHEAIGEQGRVYITLQP